MIISRHVHVRGCSKRFEFKICNLLHAHIERIFIEFSDFKEISLYEMFEYSNFTTHLVSTLECECFQRFQDLENPHIQVCYFET